MAVEGGNVDTWNWDLEIDEVIFNRWWTEMRGYSGEELDFDFSTREALAHPEDLPRAFQMLEAYIEGDAGTYGCPHNCSRKAPPPLPRRPFRL